MSDSPSSNQKVAQHTIDVVCAGGGSQSERDAVWNYIRGLQSDLEDAQAELSERLPHEPKAAPSSNEWFTPWRASGFAVYDTRNQLVVHVGITGNQSMPGAQLERMAEMIAETVNRAAHEPSGAQQMEALRTAVFQLEEAFRLQSEQAGAAYAAGYGDGLAKYPSRESAFRSGLLEPAVRPVAWMYTHHTPDSPSGPAETDADFEYGDDQPGPGWTPLYLRASEPPSATDLILARNCLGNLYTAVQRLGLHPNCPIDDDVRFAMGEAAQFLGPPYTAVTKDGSHGAAK